MRNAANEQALRTLVIDNSSLFVESGVTTALAVVKFEDKDNLVKCVDGRDRSILYRPEGTWCS